MRAFKITPLKQQLEAAQECRSPENSRLIKGITSPSLSLTWETFIEVI